ncbi:MAG TPA: hypothetical protein DCQ92_11265 [Verrucomicrobia subdivision 3 bacterium]|nr:hypothetical protein [Limisphaerales bacterium]
MKTPLPKINQQQACWLTALAMTAAAVLLHLYSLSMAGGLWRDEVGLVNIAGLPAWREIVWGLMHDHCPVVFPAVIRAWTALGWAHTDMGLRVLGLCVGLFLLSSFWFASRMMGRGLPLLALSLAALNPVVIRYGDSMRAYAFGTALMMLTIGLLWRFIEKPCWRRGLLAGLAAVASVQALYQNAFFLLAVCVAGVVVSLRQRQFPKLAGILGIGFVAALSLVPYLQPIHDAQPWWLVSKTGINQAIALSRLCQLADNFFGVWTVVVVLAVVFGVGRVFIKALQEGAVGQPDLPLFGSIALALGMAGFGVFIKLTGLPTQVWYYVPVLCFTAVCGDAVFPRVHSLTRRGVLAVALFALVYSSTTYSALRWRQTNGDRLAAQVAGNAAPEDLIIVHPWYYGVTFNFYYHGAAKWTTLPPIADYRFFRYDLIKEQLQTPDAIGPVLERVEATLRAGHRVWVVGELPPPSTGARVPVDPPVAPNGPSGWLDEPYSIAWGKKLGYLLQQHATSLTLLDDASNDSIPVNPSEKMTLTVASGWRTNSPLSRVKLPGGI